MDRDQELVIEDLGFDIYAWKSDTPVIVGSITACPGVVVQIQGNNFESLVDTSISEALFVTGAFDTRSIRVKKQIFMTVHVGEFFFETILLVIPHHVAILLTALIGCCFMGLLSISRTKKFTLKVSSCVYRGLHLLKMHRKSSS